MIFTNGGAFEKSLSPITYYIINGPCVEYIWNIIYIPSIWGDIKLNISISILDIFKSISSNIPLFPGRLGIRGCQFIARCLREAFTWQTLGTFGGRLLFRERNVLGKKGWEVWGEVQLLRSVFFRVRWEWYDWIWLHSYDLWYAYCIYIYMIYVTIVTCGISWI